MPRRILAIAIDWSGALLLSHAFFSDDNTATLLIFAGMQIVMISTIGASIGHRLAGLRLIHLKGKRSTPLVAFIRTALICLVIPVAVWDADGRGLHDKAACTALVRR